ncbi:hypothetical protein BT69DRAFT_140395 [Atractiella rhizophila]|nr:hypothetical protein BT69DRAFT_140395 [Atractiella rhizophila]
MGELVTQQSSSGWMSSSSLYKWWATVLKWIKDFALRPSQETNSFRVAFSTIPALRYKSSLPCLVGLKRIVDSSKLVTLYFETGALQLSAERSKELVGLTFIDLIPTLINSGLSLINLPYLETRSILEILYITVFKYRLDEPAMEEVAVGVVAAVKNVAPLLLEKGITYDNQLLIVSLFNCLLRRFPDMIVNILGRLIFAVMQLVAESKADDGLSIQGKAFLAAAFEKFAGRGLFVLLFKLLPLSGEGKMVKSFYEILASLQNEPKTMDSPLSLGELVLTDVTRGIFREAKEGTELVIFHSWLFLDRVYSRSMTEAIISELGAFYVKLSKHVAEMHGQLNVNPILDSCSLIIQNHPIKAKGFMVEAESALRILLPRFELKADPLSRLLTVSQSLSRPLPGLPTINFSLVYLEVICDSLRGRLRTPSTTLISLIDIMIESSAVLSSGASVSLARLQVQSGSNPTNKFLVSLCIETPKLVDDCLHYLSAGPQVERYTMTDFQAGVTVGKLLALLLWLDAKGWSAILKRQRPDDTLRALNFICLGVLSLPESSKYLALSLLPHNSTVVDHCSAVIQHCQRLMSTRSNELHNTRSPVVGELLAQAFANLQLWFLVIRRGLDGEEDAGEVERMEKSFGNGIWTDCANLLNARMSDSSVLNPIETVVWTSFADLILFLHHLSSPLVLTSASKWESLLRSLPTTIPPMHPNNPTQSQNGQTQTQPNPPSRLDPVTAKCQRALQAFENPDLILVGDQLERRKQLEKAAESELYGAVKLRYQLALATAGR